jgi:vacuolar-type H+-ATPase subunit I/STV1
MNILAFIVVYIIGVASMTYGAFWYFRDNSKKTKIVALIFGQIVMHIGLIYAIVTRLL